MEFNDIQKLFRSNGAEFITPVNRIAQLLRDIKCFIFDWDGVFNAGKKNLSNNGDFSETDAMGINLLRFGLYLVNNHEMPLIGIITGRNNQLAKDYAERENLNFVFAGYKNKTEAFNFISEHYKILPNQVAFMFDDLLDISIAKVCGLRFFVQRKCNPLFNNYILENKLCDYFTAFSGNEYAIREVSEVVIGLLGNYKEIFGHRISFSDIYAEYWNKRLNTKTNIYINQN